MGVGDDEITIGNEAIRIDFGTTVRVTALAFLDLFSSVNGLNQERAIVTYSSGSMFFDSLLSETPNGDSGFTVRHWCEHCPEEPVLAYYFHKGTVYTEWVK